MKHGQKRTKSVKKRASKYLLWRNARDAYWRKFSSMSDRSAHALENLAEKRHLIHTMRLGWHLPEGYYR